MLFFDQEQGGVVSISGAGACRIAACLLTTTPALAPKCVNLGACGNTAQAALTSRRTVIRLHERARRELAERALAGSEARLPVGGPAA